MSTINEMTPQTTKDFFDRYEGIKTTLIYPQIGDYKNSNKTLSALYIEVEGHECFFTIWFSYNTPIRFAGGIDNDFSFCTRINDWRSTTGRHLNMVSGREEKRYDSDTFENKLVKAMEEIIDKYTNKE